MFLKKVHLSYSLKIKYIYIYIIPFEVLQKMRGSVHYKYSFNVQHCEFESARFSSAVGVNHCSKTGSALRNKG